MSRLDKGEIPGFSRWRTILWPVHSFELKKLLPMLVISFLISFDYNLLRVMKDALVVTGASDAGAEVIPFIKVWVMLPGALVMTALFSYFSNHHSRERVIYTMIAIFLGYFFVFIFFLYPIRDSLHLNALAETLQGVLPAGLRGMINMVRYWSYTSFYVMSELWSNIIFSMVFWGFANQVTRIHEAKRFYGLFGVGANLSGVAAGEISASVTMFYGVDGYAHSLKFLVSLVIITGLVAMALLRWMHCSVLKDPRFIQEEHIADFKKPAGNKLSLKENLSYLLKSHYLISIALIVVSYNIVINLVEVVWKQQVRELYPNSSDYQMYMAHVTTVIGIFATLAALLVSGNSIRKFGWTFTALISPVILLVTSIGFFSFFFMKGSLDHWTITVLGVSPLALVVFFGTAQNVLSRAAKYTVFDATKEMTFVPLSVESQLKGKAAIDGVGSRLGKSGGSAIHQMLLLFFVTINQSAPYVAVVLFISIGGWIVATRSLGKKFNEMDGEMKPRAIQDPNPVYAKVTN